jgi:hypothetical protein
MPCPEGPFGIRWPRMSGRVLVLLSLALLIPCSLARAQSPQSPPGPLATTAPTPHPPPPPPPGRAPEQCGFNDETADYGELAVGTVVTLQRHRMVGGDDNWDPPMDRYLGRAAHVTRLSGVDDRGCAGIRVDVDAGAHFWRVRDVGIGTQMQPLPAVVEASDAFPQNCHQAVANYGGATIGATVVLGRHRPVDGDTNWADEMSQYVGRTAHVAGYGDLDTEGCPGIRVDIDGQQWFWRVRDLHPAGDTSVYEMFAASDTPLPPSLGVTTDHGRPAASVGGLFGSGGTPGPQACGLSEAQVVWDPIALGAEVTLGRHRDVNGDANWDTAMDPYVGLSAHITQLVGVDEQGCPVSRIDLDGGSYYWRVRDMTVTSGGTSTTPTWSGIMSWPADCGHAQASYGPVQIGSRILLGAHSPWTGPDSTGGAVVADTDWNDEMMQWVGMIATVTALDGVDPAGCAGVRVDVDGSQWFWRLRDARPAP